MTADLTATAFRAGDVVRYTGPNVNRDPELYPSWQARVGREFVVVEVSGDRVGIWDPEFRSLGGGGDTCFPKAEHCVLVRRAVEPPTLSRAEVTAALVAADAEVPHLNRTYADAVHEVATRLGIDLDDALSTPPTEPDATAGQVPDPKVQSAMDALSDRLLTKRDSLRQPDSARLTGRRLGLEEAARMARSFLSTPPAPTEEV